MKRLNAYYDCLQILIICSLCKGAWGRLGVSYSFICLSAGAVECESCCFSITLLHHAHPKVALVLVLFVIFGSLF